jgi:hypothetical protein
VEQQEFKNYGKFEDKIYKTNPLSGHTKKYQLFYCSDKEPTSLYRKESNVAETEHRMDLKKGKDVDRKDILDSFDMEFMEALNKVDGIKPIKRVELYTKWWKHVPDEYKSLLYNDPGEDVLRAVKDDRKNKKKYIKET